MLFRPRPAADSQADPHDVIIAQLRDLAPRIKNGAPQVEEASLTTPEAISTAPEATEESLVRAAPSNDNADAPRSVIPRARSYRGIFVVLLAVCSGVAATMAWDSYGDQATQRLSRLIPQFLMQTPAAEAQETAAHVDVPQSTAEAEPAQQATAVAPEPPTPSPPTEPTSVPTQAPPTEAALPAETVQSLKTMESDIAALKQAVDELRTGEQQLRQETAKAAEREAQPKPVQHTAKSAAPRRQRASSRASVPYRPSPASSPLPATQRRIHPQQSMQHDAYIPPPAPAYIPPPAPAPSRLPPQPGDDSAPRPPMPLQ